MPRKLRIKQERIKERGRAEGAGRRGLGGSSSQLKAGMPAWLTNEIAVSRMKKSVKRCDAQ